MATRSYLDFAVSDFEHYRNDHDLNKILDGINPMLDTMLDGKLVMCHGQGHARFVIDTTEYILQSLAYDARTIELGKIAALLHDIGNIAGRWRHAQKSAGLAAVLLDGGAHFTPEEKQMILHAIADHSNGNHITSAVGAAVVLADKLDLSYRRTCWRDVPLPLSVLDALHRNFLLIEDVRIHIADNIITVNCMTSADFSEELMMNDYPKALDTLVKVAAYLGCAGRFQFNGVDYAPQEASPC